MPCGLSCLAKVLFWEPRLNAGNHVFFQCCKLFPDPVPFPPGLQNRFSEPVFSWVLQGLGFVKSCLCSHTSRSLSLGSRLEDWSGIKSLAFWVELNEESSFFANGQRYRRKDCSLQRAKHSGWVPCGALLAQSNQGSLQTTVCQSLKWEGGWGRR